MLLAFLEAEISLVEVVGILISKVVQPMKRKSYFVMRVMMRMMVMMMICSPVCL